MTIDELQDEVIEEFQDFDDWMDKYQLLIDLGNEQPPLDPQYKTDDNLIDGCQSRVWLQADMRDGLLHLEAESDALIVKGIIALLIRILSDHTPAEILSADLYFIESIGLKEHLSPTRSNGLLAMVRKIRMYALALELHIHPSILYKKMFMIRQPQTPTLRHLTESLCNNTRKLRKTCRQLRDIINMGKGSTFYDDVETNETFELDFRPVNAPTAQIMRRPLFTPAMLIIILDLYFRLIPSTMTTETPDVRDVADLLDIDPGNVVDILEIYQYCDPFMRHTDTLMDPMLPPCHKIWERYSEKDPTLLSSTAKQLREYFI